MIGSHIVLDDRIPYQHVTQQCTAHASTLAANLIATNGTVSDVDLKALTIGSAAVDATAGTVIRLIVRAHIVLNKTINNMYISRLVRPYEYADSPAVHPVDTF